MNCGHQMPEFEERLEGGCIVCWHDRAEKAESAFKEERTEWVSVARLEAAVDILNRIASHKIDTTDCADVTGSEEPIECVAEWVAERMIDFQNAQDKAERERDKAQAACAEMRSVIISAILDRDVTDSQEWIDNARHAVSIFSGLGWLSPQKAKVLIEALKRIASPNYPEDICFVIAKEALAAVEGKP